MNELKENINKIKGEFQKIVDILKAFIENLDIYCDICNDLNNSFNVKSKNFEILNNIKNINSNEILDDITKIINAKSTFDKIKRIYYIYTIMNSKEENIIDENNNHKQLIGVNFGDSNISNNIINSFNNINNSYNNININKNNMLSNNNFNQNIINMNNNFNSNLINNNNKNSNININNSFSLNKNNNILNQNIFNDKNNNVLNQNVMMKNNINIIIILTKI